MEDKMAARIERPRKVYAVIVQESGEPRVLGWYQDRSTAEINGKQSMKQYQVKTVFL